MEILKLLLNNSDTIIIGMLTCYLYDKIKNHSTAKEIVISFYFNYIIAFFY